MGRIKTKLIKRITLKLYRDHKNEFKPDFKKNKGAASKIVDFPSKKMRNVITGYLTRLSKRQEKKAF